MSNYFDALKDSMTWLGQQENTIFVGQAVGCGGTFMSGTLEGVPNSKRIELPVAEQLQMQMTIGLSLSGSFPISIYPRQNFLLLTVSEIVNIIDKFHLLSPGSTLPLIIRTAVGTTRPIHPGHQHVGNFTAGLRAMIESLKIYELDKVDQILPTYQKIYQDRQTALVVEFGDLISGN